MRCLELVPAILLLALPASAETAPPPEARAAVASADRHFSDTNLDLRDSASTFELLFTALYH